MTYRMPEVPYSIEDHDDATVTELPDGTYEITETGEYARNPDMGEYGLRMNGHFFELDDIVRHMNLVRIEPVRE